MGHSFDVVFCTLFAILMVTHNHVYIIHSWYDVCYWDDTKFCLLQIFNINNPDDAEVLARANSDSETAEADQHEVTTVLVVTWRRMLPHSCLQFEDNTLVRCNISLVVQYSLEII